MSVTKIAIVGCGKQARKHIAGYYKRGNVDLVLADDVSSVARSLAEDTGCRWVDDVEDIFSDSSIQAVDICTPTASHAPLIEKTLHAGKDFFCEKPLCATAEEGRRLLALTRDSGRIGFTGFVYRSHPVFGLARSIVGEGRTTGVSPVLGKLICATMRIGGRGSHALWKHMKASDGGVINEMLVHMLDLAVWYFGPLRNPRLLMGEQLQPSRTIQGRSEAVDAEDFVIMRVEGASGLPIVIQADFITPAFTQVCEIQGENGSFMGSIQRDMPSFVHCNEARDGYAAGRTDLDFGAVNVFERQMAHFVDIVGHRTQDERGRIEDAVHVMEIVDTIRT